MTSLRRCLQRLSIIALSLMAILAITVPGAQAADGTTGTATITVNKPEDISTDLKDMTVNAYMVLSQVNPGETTVAKKQYAVTENFRAFFDIDNVKNAFKGADSVYLGYDDINNHLTSFNSSSMGSIEISSNAALDATYPQADLISRIGSNDIATFYTWIEKYIESESFGPDADATVSEANTNSIMLDNLDEGYYALTFSNVPSGIVVKQGILIPTSGSDEGAAELDLKAEQPSLVKQVKNTDHASENFSDTIPLQETTADIGDTLEYQITAQVPTLADAGNLTKFELQDTQYNQKLTGTMTLTLTKENAEPVNFIGKIPDSIDASGSSVDLVNRLNEGETIAVLTIEPYNREAAAGTGSQKFTVDFLQNGLSSWEKYQGYKITLTYQAMVTADAVRANDNDVTLYIGNNDDDTELQDDTTVYTYGIEVQKKFSDNSTTDNYDAVEFQLRTAKDDAGTAIQLSGSNGDYNVPDAESTATTATLKLSNTAGTLTITGLDLGTYWLVETNAPDGFTKAEPIQIVLVDGSATVTKDGVLDWTEEADGPTTATINNGENLVAGIENSGPNTDTTLITLAKFDVLNQKGFNLPQTGASGVWLCVAGGLVLIALGGVLFVTSRGRRNLRSDSRA